MVTSSSAFLSAVQALSSLGSSGNITVEGIITVSERTGWPAWGSTPILLAKGASLTISSQTGLSLIDFTMMSDRIVLVPPGILYLNNILAVNLCTFQASVGLFDVKVYLTYPIFPIWHSWSRNATRALYVKNSAVLVPRTELQMMIYWCVISCN